MTDSILDEIKDIGSHVTLALINEPLPVEHCPCCGTGYSRTLTPAVVIRTTDPEWATQSACTIYINPETPSLAVVLFLRDDKIYAGSLHLCQGRFLHYHSEEFDERLTVEPKPSIRAQATRIVETILKDWSPAKLLIGTGNPDAPELIDSLNLPACWEKRSHPQAQEG